MEDLIKSRKIEKIKSIWDLTRFPIDLDKLKIPYNGEKLVSKTHDQFDILKYPLKFLPNLYSWLRNVMSPVCPNFVIENKIKSLDLKNLIVVNVGSGNTFLDKEIINTDFIPYPNVDLVTDALNLPFKNNTVDAIACLSVLEHVPNPTGVVAEFQRILKPGGQIFCVIPFMQGYHASPHDYTRFTVSGMKELFKNFEIIILEPEGGPTSALLWIFQEWLATLLSFGIKKIHRILLIILMFSLWPIKFLDLIMIKYSTSNNISSLFRIIVKKK